MNREQKHAELAYVGISILALAAYVLVALNNVYTFGVCCADDAYFAVIAKNLASGLGYVSTIPAGRWQFIPVEFDAYATTGPTLIMPTALLIRLFGNEYWVPGLTLVVCWSCLLVLLGLLLRRQTSGPRLALFSGTFLFLCQATPWYYSAWYILLGEVPAGLLLVLGVLLFYHSENRTWRFLAGVLLGLAILSKTLAFLGVAVLLTTRALSAVWVEPRGLLRRLARDLGPLCVGVGIPLAAFESWRLVALGAVTYAERSRESLEILFSVGVKAPPTTSLLVLVAERTAAFKESFGISLPVLIALVCLAWLLARRDPTIRHASAALGIMVLVYSLWWLFLSLAWPRYIVLPLVAAYAAVALPFVGSSLPRKALFCYAAIILLASTPLWPHLRYRLGSLVTRPVVPRVHTQAQLEVAAILEGAVAENRMIVTEFWATGADLEYTMETHGNFVRFTDRGSIGTQPFLVALNTSWMATGDMYFAQILEFCHNRRKIDVYFVADCHLPPAQ